MVDYSSSDDSDADEMVLISKKGGGVRDDFSMDSSEDDQLEEISVVGSVDEAASVSESDEDITLPYEVEETLADVSDNENVEIESGGQDVSDISIGSEPESVQEEAVSQNEEDSASDDSEPESVHEEAVSQNEEDSASDNSVSSDAGFVRRSVRVSRPPTRYSP